MSLLPDIDSLSLAEQVGQMVVVRASGHLFDPQIRYPVWEPLAATLQRWLEELNVGGAILLGGSAAEIGVRSQQLQHWARIPLFVAADIEEGVGQRFAGATWFPPPLALAAVADKDMESAIRYATQMGACTAQEAMAMGLNWVLAPVVDVNNNPDNPVINVRAFGEIPETVSQLATAFIRGAHSYPVLTAAKHFPGHGDTGIDSHLELPVLSHSPERLARIERPPFVAAIAAGVDSVMSAHLLIPAWDAERPATLSPRILTGELRQALQFQGLIVTDALVMGAIAKRYGPEEAPVMAVEAGADILLMPPDPETAIQSVCAAVDSGRIAAEQICCSVERIWRAKQKVCLPPPPETNAGSPDIAPISLPIQLQPLAQPQARATVAAILRDSMVIRGTLPWNPAADSSSSPRNLIVVDNLLNCSFLDFQVPAIALPEQQGCTTQLCDCHTPLPAPADSFHPTLLQLFIRGNPFRGSANLNQMASIWRERLLKKHELHALVIYGSPYIWEQFSQDIDPAIPCLFSYGQMPLAQTIALNMLFGLSSQASPAWNPVFT